MNKLPSLWWWSWRKPPNSAVAFRAGRASETIRHELLDIFIGGWGEDNHLSAAPETRQFIMCDRLLAAYMCAGEGGKKKGDELMLNECFVFYFRHPSHDARSPPHLSLAQSQKKKKKASSGQPTSGLFSSLFHPPSFFLSFFFGFPRCRKKESTCPSSLSWTKERPTSRQPELE